MGLLIFDTFDRPDTTIINPPADGGSDWTILDTGVWAIQSNSLACLTSNLSSVIIRDAGTTALDARWSIRMFNSLLLSSQLILCWAPDTPGHPGSPKYIGIGYDGSSVGSFTVGIEDWGGFTPLGAGAGIAHAVSSFQTGTPTVIRASYEPSIQTITVYQDSIQIYSGVLSTLEADGLGTQAGVRFRTDYLYNSSLQAMTDFQVYLSEPIPTQSATPRVTDSFFSSPANRRTMG